ncbi:MAG: hypothetical protein JOY52_16720 [Hyphomicrobiales bacterium]|nr:hypothetical protein [Hyphomicrobiales bacterium]
MELAGADGAVHSHEISVGGADTLDHSAETLGLTLAEGKKALAGLQRHLVQAQSEGSTADFMRSKQGLRVGNEIPEVPRYDSRFYHE